MIEVVIPPLLVWLCASVGIERAYERHGSDIWRNPGGWRFPKGETAAFRGASLGILLTAVVGMFW